MTPDTSYKNTLATALQARYLTRLMLDPLFPILLGEYHDARGALGTDDPMTHHLWQRVMDYASSHADTPFPAARNETHDHVATFGAPS